MNAESDYDSYGVIMEANNDCIQYVQIRPIGRFTKCYNDVGAVKERDKDNVRLNDCPADFKFYAGHEKLGAYVYADMDNLGELTKEQCKFYDVNPMLDGDGNFLYVSKPMYKEIRSHPWQEQYEEEFVRDSSSDSSLQMKLALKAEEQRKKQMESSSEYVTQREKELAHKSAQTPKFERIRGSQSEKLSRRLPYIASDIKKEADKEFGV